MDFLIQDAWAQGAGATGDQLLSMLPLLLIFVVFYFFLIRPQTTGEATARTRSPSPR